MLSAKASEFLSINDIEIENKQTEKTHQTVFLTHEFLEKGILKINVNTKDALTPVIGAAFHLKFDNEKIEFLKYLPGDFLERGGDPMYLVTQKSDKIIFGETLTSKDMLPVGEGLLAEIYFQTKKEKPYYFSFENGVLSTLTTVMQDIEEVEFSDYEIIDEENEKKTITISSDKNILASTLNFFSLKNVLLILIPSTAMFFTLWTIYLNKIKPKIPLND